MTPDSDTMDAVATIPKVELHQHVDGSIPVTLTWELMREHGLNPVESLEDMERLLTLQPDEEGTLIRYLDKFHYPAWITQFYENITRVVEAIVAEAVAHGVTAPERGVSPLDHTLAGLPTRRRSCPGGRPPRPSPSTAGRGWWGSAWGAPNAAPRRGSSPRPARSRA